MEALNFSHTLNRMLRQDAAINLGLPTRKFLENAVREGNAAESVRWLDYYLLEFEQIQYIFGVWNWHMVRYYLDRQGDAKWPQLIQQSMAPWVGTSAGVVAAPTADVEIGAKTVRLTIPKCQRKFYLTEREDRFYFSLDSPEAQKKKWTGWRTEVETAINAHKFEIFIKLLDDYVLQARIIHDVLCDWAWALLTVMIRTWGESILGEVLRVTEEPWVTVRYEKMRDLSTAESLQLTIEGMRGHFSGPNRAGEIMVTEEADRYVLSFNACGTGGRMRRGDPLAATGSRMASPYNFLNVEGAYDWTWNRKGVCAYCAHCSVVNQILPIEKLGHPMRMTQYPENPDDPCRWIIYKDATAFPIEAFSEVGQRPR